MSSTVVMGFTEFDTVVMAFSAGIVPSAKGFIIYRPDAENIE
jgi:hypothetical protein